MSVRRSYSYTSKYGKLDYKNWDTPSFINTIWTHVILSFVSKHNSSEEDHEIVKQDIGEIQADIPCSQVWKESVLL